MAQYRYLRGSKDSYEAVEFDVTKDGGNTYITTCVINVCLLLAGITAFPCGNGDDIKLTPEQQLETLEYLQAELKDVEKQEVREVWTDITCSKRRNPWVVHLSAVIGENYCCKGCRKHRPGEQTQYIGFIGLEDDVEVCLAIFKYAVDCILAEIGRIKKENQCYYGSYVKKLCDSYGYGFTVGISAAFEKQQEVNEEGWGLVLVMPQEVLEASKHLGNEEFHSRAEKTISGDAYSKGYRQGKEFDPTKRLAGEGAMA